jgi:hypothetical protein
MPQSINTRLFLSLSFLITATSSVTARGISYTEARECFKEDLYARQGGLMERDAYLKFIEPHLKKAETELAIPKHLQTKPGLNDKDERYMNELARCNVALFHRDINPNNPRVKMGFDQCKQNLEAAIRSVKTSDRVALDVDSELSKTFELLTTANKEFYKKLGVGNKTLLAANKMLLWFVQ